MTRQSILTVPWVVLEEATPAAPVTAERDLVTVCAQPVEPAAIDDAPSDAGGRWAWLFVGLSVVWFILTAVLFVAGALTPVRGNVLTYFVMMAGLFLAAFVALTCPRESEDHETFWTWGGEPVGQCTPSRNTLTGR